jgi:hypothetical protein
MKAISKVMKTNSIYRDRVRTLATAATLLAAAQFAAQASTIHYVGTLTNSTETVNWLTPTTVKTYDIDGDNKYGSFVGIYFTIYGNYSADTITYASSGGQYLQPEYPLINDLRDACQGNAGVGALVNNAPTNKQASIALTSHTFNVPPDLTGKTLRMGVMSDCLGAAETASDIRKALVVVQTIGGTARSVIVPVPDANRQPDMTFFDIVDAQAGDQYSAIQLRTLGAFSPLSGYVGAISWDMNDTSLVTATVPVITATVGGGTVRTNGGYHFAALAGGAPSVSHQWYKGTTLIAGATNATYDLSHVTAADAAAYKVVAKTSAGSVTSAVATLSVSATSLPTRITGFQSAASAQPGLFAYYSFENLCADSAGTNHGSFAGTPGVGVSIGSGAGLGNDSGLACNGANGFVQAASDANLDFNNANLDGTVCAWVRPGWTNNLQSEYFLANGSTSARCWAVGVGGNRDNIRFSNGAATGVATIPQMTTTNWYLVSVVFSNGTYRSFLNGTLRGSGALAFGATSGQPLIIGAINEIGDSAWSGGLDEIAIYTNALSDAAILSLYNAYVASDPPQITVQPDPGNYFLTGTPFSLSVTAVGNLIHYQWYTNGVPLPGEITNFINFASLAPANSATYVCVVANTAGSVTSSPCVIKVSSPIATPLVNYEAAVTNTLSLISLYPFNDLTANDAVGANQGTLVGTTQFRAGVASGPDQALALGGTGLAELGNVPDFDFSDSTGTVELWLRADWTSIGFNPCIFAARQDGGAGVNYSIHMGGAKDRIYFFNGSVAPFIMLPAPAGSNWHHLAIVFEYGNWTVVWDGEVAGTGVVSLGGAAAPVHLGSSSSAGQELWTGRLDEVAFYADALTPAQVADHYTRFAGSFPPAWSSQPASAVVMGGNDMTLSGTALGASINYQWLKNGVVMADATNNNLSFVPATAAVSGAYQLVAANGGGSITSSVANVSVVTAQPASYQAAVRGTPGLVSMYPFDEGNANDYVSTNHGTPNGTVTYTNGVGGYLALALDGMSWVTFGSVPAFDAVSGTLSIEAWVRADWDPAAPPFYNPTLVGNSVSGSSPYFNIRMSADKKSIITFGGAADAIPDAGTNWHPWS